MSKYIELQDVKKIYKMGDIEIKASDGIDFDINTKERDICNSIYRRRRLRYIKWKR